MLLNIQVQSFYTYTKKNNNNKKNNNKHKNKITRKRARIV